MPPLLDEEKCTCCGACVDVCQSDVFSARAGNGLPSVAYPEECWHCGACVTVCPVHAVALRIPLPMMVCYK